jgi:hypothetical protein
MNFTFNDDQLLFRDTVRDLLTHEVTAERIRQRWDSATGIDSAALKSMVDLGLTAALVPEAQGGLGLNAVDFILLAEECGRAALPEPIVDSCLVATPMLVDADRALDGGNSCLLELLEGIAAGEQTVLCGPSINPYINYAHCADYLLLPHGNEVHLVAVKDVELERQTSVDLSRRLSKVNWIPRSETCIASGEMGADLWRSSLNRGALGNAAQLLGLTEAMVARSVQFATDREQFGESRVCQARDLSRSLHRCGGADSRRLVGISRQSQRWGRGQYGEPQLHAGTRCHGLHLGVRPAHMDEAGVDPRSRVG